MKIIVFKIEKYAPRAESRTHYCVDFVEALDWFNHWVDDSKNEKIAFSACALTDSISFEELAARCLNHSNHIKLEILLDAKERKAEKALRPLGESRAIEERDLTDD